MASTIQIKRTGQGGGTPSAIPSLSAGELAVDLVNKVLYTANNTTTFELARNTANNGLVLHDGSGNEIRVTAPALSSDYSFTLPQNNGTNEQFLQTNGSGTLTWATPSGSGNVNAVNSPSDNQLAIWTDGTTIEGNNNVTFDPTGSGTFTLGSSVDLSVGGNATITGDLTVNGTTTTLNVNDIIVEDAIIALANTNSADTIDIGIAGTYNDGATKWFAMVRDASETDEAGTGKIIRVLDDITTNPTTTTTITGGSLAQLDAVIDGGTYNSLQTGCFIHISYNFLFFIQ